MTNPTAPRQAFEDKYQRDASDIDKANAKAKEQKRRADLFPEMLDALRRAVLALAFAAESSPAMRDDYEAVSAAIAKATEAP